MQKKNQNSFQRKWWLIDAQGQVLGRLATRIADLLRGKKKTIFSPELDVGDYVIVTNAKEIVLTGKKLKQKIYFRHSGYSQGAKYISVGEVFEKKPSEVLRVAVSGMLPKNKLREKFLKRLKIYAGQKHPDYSQNIEQVSGEDKN